MAFRLSSRGASSTYKNIIVAKVSVTSVLIADHTKGQIQAAMGSFNFEDHDGGQVIGFTARRSVGSTPKPYIYALALDRGLALPKMLCLTFHVNLVPIRRATMMVNIGDWCPWTRR